jgi:hypothetical protein
LLKVIAIDGGHRLVFPVAQKDRIANVMFLNRKQNEERELQFHGSGGRERLPARRAVWTYLKRLWRFHLLERRLAAQGKLQYKISEQGLDRLRWWFPTGLDSRRLGNAR